MEGVPDQRIVQSLGLIWLVPGRREGAWPPEHLHHGACCHVMLRAGRSSSVPREETRQTHTLRSGKAASLSDSLPDSPSLPQTVQPDSCCGPCLPGQGVWTLQVEGNRLVTCKGEVQVSEIGGTSGDRREIKEGWAERLGGVGYSSSSTGMWSEGEEGGGNSRVGGTAVQRSEAAVGLVRARARCGLSRERSLSEPL